MSDSRQQEEWGDKEGFLKALLSDLMSNGMVPVPLEVTPDFKKLLLEFGVSAEDRGPGPYPDASELVRWFHRSTS
jgi:hypothetical protein